MDQRGKREMFIGGVHQKDTITLQNREERLKQVQVRKDKEKEQSAA